MTVAQLNRILSGLNLPTDGSEFNAPMFRTITLETRQGIDGDADLLKVDSSHELLLLKEFDARDITNNLTVYNIESVETSNQYIIRFFGSLRRVKPGDYIFLADKSAGTLTNLGITTNAGTSFAIISDARVLNYNQNTCQIFAVASEDFGGAIVSPKDKYKLINLTPLSENTAYTYMDINKIIAIEMSSSLIGSYGV